ncbi:MAG: PAS domain S-box protein [Planctomycetes bacterium]|nr:PAS domain S-box protein [Planctomycetota bacterium]
MKESDPLAEFDLAPEAIVLVDREGEIAHANKKAESLFGYGPGELQGLELDVLVPERFRGMHKDGQLAFFDNPYNRDFGVLMDIIGLERKGGEIPLDIRLEPVHVDGELLAKSVIRVRRTQ